MRDAKAFKLMMVVAIVATGWSAIRPYHYATWFFELFLGAIGVAVLLFTYRRFRFSPVVYLVVAVHYVILAAGAKYTYAEMPLFDWLKEAFDLSRNHFDRVGHLAQGVTPAIVVRELLIRQTRLVKPWVRDGLSVSVALAFSAAYEILEWFWVLVFFPDSGPQWLGMQGDPWDAQADMLLAVIGGTVAIALIGRVQDRQIRTLVSGQTDAAVRS